MSLRIAFDLDGVLADMESELARQAESLFGDQVTRSAQEPADTPSAQPESSDSTDTETPLLRLPMTARQQHKLWRHIGAIEGFWETLKETEPGIVARLAAVATQRGWELIFLTKRPRSAGATAQVQTQRWLEANGFALPSVYVVQGSRGLIAAALDLHVVVDDRPENCLDVVTDSKARAILVWRDDEALIPAAVGRLGIDVVSSVGQCLDNLTDLDSAPEGRAGVLGRVMRLLGLKDESANT
jgi:hypothetical protein